MEADNNTTSYRAEQAVSAAFAVPQANNTRQERSPPTGANPKACRLCDKLVHFWAKCRVYRSGCERIVKVRTVSLCTSSLSRKHGKHGCNNSKIGPCKLCQKKHFFGLCPKHGKQNQTTEYKEPRETSTTLTSVAMCKSTTILPTIQ